MLKRQRHPSPPPASSNVHLLADLGAEERHVKRRRTQQLDGAANQAVDDDDSYDGHLDNFAVDAAAQDLIEMTKTSEEYKSANTMLRELHILNQHRLMFSPPSPNSLSTTQMSLDPTHQSSLYPMSYLSHSAPPTKLLHPMQTGKLPTLHPPRHKTAEQDQFQAGPLEELGVVSDNYENINKLLGSLFLSRRRALDSSSHNVSYS